MSRHATRTSTVYSKTTPKIISKKSNVKGPQKDDMSDRKMRELRNRFVTAQQEQQGDVQTAVAARPVATYAQKAGGSVSFVIPNASTNKEVLKTTEVLKATPKVQQPAHQLIGGNPAQPPPPTGPRLAPQGAPTGPRHLPQSEWRGGPNRSTFGSQAQDRRPQQSIQGTNSRPTDVRHFPNEYDEGTIFSTATHEHDYDQSGNKVGANENQTLSRFGVVQSKFRKFVVVSKFGNHVVALPVYTNQHHGLTKTEHKNEWIAIREISLKATAAGSENSHPVLWAMLFQAFEHQSDWHKMDDNTNIHFTSPYSHKMTHKCTISGRLEPESLITLRKLWRKAILTEPSNATIKTAPTTYKLPQNGNSITDSRNQMQRQGVASRSRAQPAGNYRSASVNTGNA